MIRISSTIATLLAAAFAMTPSPAATAQEPEPYTYRWYKRDAYWAQFYCGGRYRPEGCRAYRYRRWGVRHRPVTIADAVCHERTDATGEQAQSKDNAEALALRAWQGRVRFKFGERFIDFANARDARIACSPSSVADTVGGKLQDKVLGISHFRCELSARPCRALPRKVDNHDDD